MGATWWLMAICLLCCVFCACHKNYIEPVTDDEGQEVMVTLSVKLPGVSDGVKTYALSDADENFLKDVDVLVFTDDGSGMTFRYRSVGTDIVQSTGTGISAEIKVRLWRTDVDTRLVILANVREQVNNYDFDTGVTTLGDFQTGLIYELSLEQEWLAHDGNFTPLPMWAAYDVVGGIDEGIKGDIGSLTEPISLLRSLARVDIAVDPGITNFVLTDVYVYNSNASGSIIPDELNFDATQNRVTAVSLPSTLNNSRLHYDEIGVDNALNGEIYLFEAGAATNFKDAAATALVIGGLYNGTDQVFYRIDFRNPVDTTQAQPILRNHRYQINVTGIAGITWTSANPDVAFNMGSIPPKAAFGPAVGRSPGRSGSRQSLPPYSGTILPSSSGITYSVTAIDENQ